MWGGGSSWLFVLLLLFLWCAVIYSCRDLSGFCSPRQTRGVAVGYVAAPAAPPVLGCCVGSWGCMHPAALPMHCPAKSPRDCPKQEGAALPHAWLLQGTSAPACSVLPYAPCEQPGQHKVPAAGVASKYQRIPFVWGLLLYLFTLTCSTGRVMLGVQNPAVLWHPHGRQLTLSLAVPLPAGPKLQGPAFMDHRIPALS